MNGVRNDVTESGHVLERRKGLLLSLRNAAAPKPIQQRGDEDADDDQGERLPSLQQLEHRLRFIARSVRGDVPLRTYSDGPCR